jgi:hypothetical protein
MQHLAVGLQMSNRLEETLEAAVVKCLETAQALIKFAPLKTEPFFFCGVATHRGS